MGTKKSLQQIFDWFKRGKYPTQEHFEDTFSSFWHKDDMIPNDKIENFHTLLNEKYNKKDGEALEERMEEAETRLTGHDEKLEIHESALEKHEEWLKSHDIELEGHKEWLENHDKNIKKIEDRLDGNDITLKEHTEHLTVVDAHLDRHDKSILKIEGRLDGHDRTLEQHGNKLTTIDGRLNNHDQDIATIKETLDSHTEVLDEHGNTLNDHTGTLEEHTDQLQMQEEAMKEFAASTNNSITVIEKRLGGHDENIEKIDSTLKTHREDINNNTRDISSHNVTIIQQGIELNNHEKWLKDHDQELMDVNTCLDGHKDRLDNYGSRIENNESAITKLQTTEKAHTSRLQAIESDIDEIQKTDEHQEMTFGYHDERIKNNEKNILTLLGQNLDARLSDTEEELMDHKRLFNDQQQQIDNIQVGTCNLLTGSYSGEGWTGNTPASGGTLEEGVFTKTTSGSAEVHITGPKNIPVLANTTYTFTVYMKATTNLKSANLYIIDVPTGDKKLTEYKENIYVSAEWQKYTWAFTTSNQWSDNRDNPSMAYIRFDNNGSMDGEPATLWITKPMLAEGNKAGDWCLSSLEILDNVSKKITNALADYTLDVETRLNEHETALTTKQNKLVSNDNSIAFMENTDGTTSISVSSGLAGAQPDNTGGTKVLTVTSPVVNITATSQINYIGFNSSLTTFKIVNNSDLQTIFSFNNPEAEEKNRILKDFSLSNVILPAACSMEFYNTGKGWRIINTFGFSFFPDLADDNRKEDEFIKVNYRGLGDTESAADFIAVDESVMNDFNTESLDNLYPDAVSGFQLLCPTAGYVYVKISNLGGWLKYSTTKV